MRAPPVGAKFFLVDGWTDGRTDRQTDIQTHLKTPVCSDDTHNSPSIDPFPYVLAREVLH